MNHAAPDDDDKPAGPLKRGWTTGTCAAAATRAAYELLVTGHAPAAVDVLLPNGARPVFAVAMSEPGPASATAGIVKDAGDDPDVTHGALVKATVSPAPPGSGVVFRAGDGVGMVTKPGLPIPPGEPAINPVPRQMIRTVIDEAARLFGGPSDVVVEISIPGGAALAARTLNARLGIVGGLSILGTTGVVVPYSCAAWINSIHRGIDVARASGLTHVAGATGATSEKAVQALHGLPDTALIEMGNFAGGMLKYLRRHPVPRLTIAGGAGKMAKLAQGLLDLHSKRGSVDREFLSGLLEGEGGGGAGGEPDATLRDAIIGAVTTDAAVQAADAAGARLADAIAAAARKTVEDVLRDADVTVDVVVVGRGGSVVGRG